MSELISIVIPLYNAEKYLRQTLESAEAQTYDNWECIIIDDGSSDSSAIVAKEFVEKDSRFSYHHQTNGGAASARNHGVSLSNGEFIQYLDADDVMLPEKLEKMLAVSRTLKSDSVLYCDMIGGQHDDIHAEMPLRFALNLGHPVTFDEAYRKYPIEFAITPICFLFPREVVEKMKWNTALGPAEDWDYFLQVLDANYTFQFLPEVLAKYRNTPDSYSKNHVKSLKSHYYVLIDWANKRSGIIIPFIRRTALLYKRSIFLYLLKKADRVVTPHNTELGSPLALWPAMLVVYAATLWYIAVQFWNIAVKRILKPKQA